jgi:hypothetical protein
MAFALTGFLYGGVLAFLAFLAAGFGHGTYVLAGLSSSPLSLFGNIPLALLSPPLLWSAIGALSGAAKRRVARICLLLGLVAHYASIPIVLQSPSAFADWEYLPRVQGVVWLGIIVYIVGQAAIWVALGVHISARKQ